MSEPEIQTVEEDIIRLQETHIAELKAQIDDYQKSVDALACFIEDLLKFPVVQDYLKELEKK